MELTLFEFQSTLPLRGATRRRGVARNPRRDFNPRSPCGERRSQPTPKWRRFLFQSTLPLRGATGRHPVELHRHQISIHAPLAGSDADIHFMHLPIRISIHAPLAGSDSQRPVTRLPSGYFNPRSPCGERPNGAAVTIAPLDFNPRSPCGERPPIRVLCAREFQFQSTLPLRGATTSAGT